MNKTIFIKNKDIQNWKQLNPDYNIQLNQENDCTGFFNENFKSDILGFSKLYQLNGIYVNLNVNYTDFDKILQPGIIYLLLDNESIIPDFIVNFSKPKSPLFLHFLVSFLINGSSTNNNELLYNCLKYNLNLIDIKPEKKYIIEQVKIKVDIGTSKTNTKIINLFYFPDDVKYTVNLHTHSWNDTFRYCINKNQLVVTRTDSEDGWGYPHICDICIDCNETIYLLKYNNKIIKYQDTILLNKSTDSNNIYMTYKKEVPEKVKQRWQDLNPDYNIELSLDNDCIRFLNENFNKYITELFKTIPVGMYKADLWRICKLYKLSGVYADVDLVPYIDIDKTLSRDISFYTSFSNATRNCFFQAFIVNFSKPKSPIFLHFLVSFLINEPYNYKNGPCFDMYNCIKYNLNLIDIEPEKKYIIEQVKIKVDIGTSKTNTKIINLFYFPIDVKYTVNLHKHDLSDKLYFYISKNQLFVTRTDSEDGWGYPHICDICIDCNETIYLFEEKSGSNNGYFVEYQNNKILDSRDPEYSNNGGW